MNYKTETIIELKKCECEDIIFPEPALIAYDVKFFDAKLYHIDSFENQNEIEKYKPAKYILVREERR